MGTDWQANRMGPYRLVRRLRSARQTGEVGRVYTAWHRPSGRPALVVVAAAPAHHAPRGDWRVRLRAAVHPTPHVALEVELAPTGAVPLQELSAGLDAACQALEDFERHPEAHSHLSAPPAPRRNGAKPYWPALALAALAAGVCVPTVWRADAPAHAPAASEANVAEEVLAMPRELPVAALAGRREWASLGLPMPEEPFPGQYRVDKAGRCKGRVEEPIKGGCWVGLKLKPPCGTDAYEHKGGCYWPSMPAAREPTSVLPVPPAPAREGQQ